MRLISFQIIRYDLFIHLSVCMQNDLDRYGKHARVTLQEA